MGAPAVAGRAFRGYGIRLHSRYAGTAYAAPTIPRASCVLNKAFFITDNTGIGSLHHNQVQHTQRKAFHQYLKAL